MERSFESSGQCPPSGELRRARGQCYRRRRGTGIKSPGTRGPSHPSSTCRGFVGTSPPPSIAGRGNQLWQTHGYMGASIGRGADIPRPAGSSALGCFLDITGSKRKYKQVALTNFIVVIPYYDGDPRKGQYPEKYGWRLRKYAGPLQGRRDRVADAIKKFARQQWTSEEGLMLGD